MKKITVFLGSLVVGMLFLGITALADTTGFAAGDVINVRQVPAMDAKVLTEIYLADPVSVITTEGSWCKIRINDQIGYVHKDLIVFDRSLVPEPTPVARTTSRPSSSGGGKSSSSTPVSAPDASLASQIVAYSKNFLGVPYVWGGTTPNGFDCSGFVQYVYRHFGIYLPRTTYSQIAMGRSVSRANLAPGDLVFFRSARHVGIYVGNNQYIHAPQTGRTISIDSMANRSLYAARRII